MVPIVPSSFTSIWSIPPTHLISHLHCLTQSTWALHSIWIPVPHEGPPHCMVTCLTQLGLGDPCPEPAAHIDIPLRIMLSVWHPLPGTSPHFVHALTLCYKLILPTCLTQHSPRTALPEDYALYPVMVLTSQVRWLSLPTWMDTLGLLLFMDAPFGTLVMTLPDMDNLSTCFRPRHFTSGCWFAWSGSTYSAWAALTYSPPPLPGLGYSSQNTAFSCLLMLMPTFFCPN